MSKSGQAFIAATQGTRFTLYAACTAMGISLTQEQDEFQTYLESIYPPVVLEEIKKEEENNATYH